MLHAPLIACRDWGRAQHQGEQGRVVHRQAAVLGGGHSAVAGGMGHWWWWVVRSGRNRGPISGQRRVSPRGDGCQRRDARRAAGGRLAALQATVIEPCQSSFCVGRPIARAASHVACCLALSGPGARALCVWVSGTSAANGRNKCRPPACPSGSWPGPQLARCSYLHSSGGKMLLPACGKLHRVSLPRSCRAARSYASAACRQQAASSQLPQQGVWMAHYSMLAGAGPGAGPGEEPGEEQGGSGAVGF